MRQETSYLKETLRQSLLCTGDFFLQFYDRNPCLSRLCRCRMIAMKTWSFHFEVDFNLFTQFNVEMWMVIVSTSKYLLSCEYSVCMSVCESYLHSDHPSSAQLRRKWNFSLTSLRTLQPLLASLASLRSLRSLCCKCLLNIFL